MDNKNRAYSLTDRLGRTRHYMGGYWTFLATGDETNGQFALMEVNMRKGIEPPRHTHTNEDESFHLIEGEVLFSVGDEEYLLKAGDFLHIPKGIPHHFSVRSDTVKMLAQVVPAGLENFFIQLSKPADRVDFPPAPTGPPPAEWLLKVAALQEEYGIVGMDHSLIKSS